MNNSSLIDKLVGLQKNKKLFIYEINGLTYYKKNRDVMLNRVKDIMKIIKKD